MPWWVRMTGRSAASSVHCASFSSSRAVEKRDMYPPASTVQMAMPESAEERSPGRFEGSPSQRSKSVFESPLQNTEV